jgi:hypothetical protein
MAYRAPHQLPSTQQQVAGSTSFHITWPPAIHTAALATLEARFATLAQPDAVSKSMPSTSVNAMIRKVPVPGPMSPSYTPITSPMRRLYTHSRIGERFFAGCSFLPKSGFKNSTAATAGRAISRQVFSTRSEQSIASRAPRNAPGSAPHPAQIAVRNLIFAAFGIPHGGKSRSDAVDHLVGTVSQMHRQSHQQISRQGKSVRRPPATESTKPVKNSRGARIRHIFNKSFNRFLSFLWEVS